MDTMEMTYEDVRTWILANSDDKEAMDAINKLTYVFTSKFGEQQKKDN